MSGDLAAILADPILTVLYLIASLLERLREVARW